MDYHAEFTCVKYSVLPKKLINNTHASNNSHTINVFLIDFNSLEIPLKIYKRKIRPVKYCIMLVNRTQELSKSSFFEKNQHLKNRNTFLINLKKNLKFLFIPFLI